MRRPKSKRAGKRAPAENHRLKYFQVRADQRFSERNLLDHVPGVV